METGAYRKRPAPPGRQISPDGLPVVDDPPHLNITPLAGKVPLGWPSVESLWSATALPRSADHRRPLSRCAQASGLGAEGMRHNITYNDRSHNDSSHAPARYAESHNPPHRRPGSRWQRRIVQTVRCCNGRKELVRSFAADDSARIARPTATRPSHKFFCDLFILGSRYQIETGGQW
jgi:hypothetical protein